MAIPWKPEHEAILHRPGITIEEAARLTGRAPNAVRQKAYKLGVTIYPAGTVTPTTMQDVPLNAPQSPQTHDDTDDDSLIVGVRSRDKHEDLAEYWHHMKQVMSVQIRRHTGTRNLSYGLGEGYVSIAFLGDTHIGAFMDAERLEADIAAIAATDNMYVVFMGDVIDNYKAGSKASTGLYGTAIPSPKDQYAIARLVLEPLRGKCLAFLAGNHDAGWDERHAGVNGVPDLAAHLDAPYIPESGASIKLHIGSERYQVNVKHQWRGISTINKSNVTRRFWEEYPEFDSADVVCIGHYHEIDAHSTNKRGELVHLLRSGTYKVNDPYSETAGFKPTYGVPVAMFDPHDHKVRIDTALDDGIRRLASYR